MKNIAGNDVSFFLFRFELHGNGIGFVLNETIAADMYQDVDEKLRPLVHAYWETLLRYRGLGISNIIMDDNFLAGGGFEVMLSKGLGLHVSQGEKDLLFQDAKNISGGRHGQENRGTEKWEAIDPIAHSAPAKSDEAQRRA